MDAEDVNERRKKKEGRKAGDVVLRTFPVWLVGPEGQAIKGNAFLDDGSDSTYVRDNIITALGLVTDERNLTLSTLTESYVPLKSKKVTLTIKGLDGESKSTVEAWTLHEMYQGLSFQTGTNTRSNGIILRPLHPLKPLTGTRLTFLLG